MSLDRGMPPMKPVQLDLAMPGCESALEAAWRVTRRQISRPMTLTEALERPLLGRLIRLHAAAIERQRRDQGRRRARRC